MKVRGTAGAPSRSTRPRTAPRRRRPPSSRLRAGRGHRRGVVVELRRAGARHGDGIGRPAVDGQVHGLDRGRVAGVREADREIGGRRRDGRADRRRRLANDHPRVEPGTRAVMVEGGDPSSVSARSQIATSSSRPARASAFPPTSLRRPSRSGSVMSLIAMNTNAEATPSPSTRSSTCA